MLSLALILAVATGPAEVGSCQNFGSVGPLLYRGAEPDAACLDQLAKLGVRTIVSLRDDDEDTERERAWAKTRGIRFESVPMSGFRRPDDAEVRRALDVIGSAGNEPVFVHCKRGRDRTGVIIAAWRLSREGWTLEQAWDEAKRFRLAFWQVRMKDFIRDFAEAERSRNTVPGPSGAPYDLPASGGPE